MNDWYEIARRVEPLEDVPLDRALVRDLQRACETHANRWPDTIRFYTPTFKSFRSSEISGCGKSAWPAVSTTAGECKLQCDHCKAKILEFMIPARTPEALWRIANEVIADGARGMLLTGGSNHRNEVEYGPYYATIRRIKDEFPDFRIALHTALVDEDIARCMEQSGIDAAMMDVIGAQETIARIYHLRRRVEDFERSLEALVTTRMKVVPHIVVGLHYGRLLGERNALEIIRRHRPDALVLVVVMPFYAPAKRPFETPDADAVGRFFLDARGRLPDFPLLLGCARPPGTTKARIDAYAVLAGLDGIAHPSDGIVELAARLERRVQVTPACCSIMVGGEAMALDGDGGGLELDLDTLLAEERARRRGAALGRIPVATEVVVGGCGR